MWSKVRLTAYITAGFGAVATLENITGLAVYDPATGMIDPAPFNVNLLAGVVAPVVSSFIAGIAVKLGWGSK